jgi:hypothetical protein
VEIVLFPVKLALLPTLMLASAPLVGCGYHTAFGASGPSYRLTVASAPLGIPHPEVLAAVLSGVRAELGKDGALESGSGYPRLVVELLRVDEVAAGIAATSTAQGTLPLGRASAIGVSARGWIEEKPGAGPARDTGDVRSVETVAQGDDSVSGSLAAGEAARTAGRRTGESVARRALGMAEPAVEPM